MKFKTNRGYFLHRCVTFCVWLFVVATALGFLLLQLLFQRAQSQLFAALYTEDDLTTYRDSSVCLTICSYFLCGSPPRLLLGRLYIGRVVFLLLSFSCLIIGTVLQSGMVTRLSSYMRYPDVQTLKELREEGYLIQTPDIDALSSILDSSKHASLGSKLTSSFRYYCDIIDQYLDSTDLYANFTTEVISHHEGARGNFDMDEDALPPAVRVAQKNLRAIMTSDAFVLGVPRSLLVRENFVMAVLYSQGAEFHRVEECLATFPYVYRVLRNSYLFEAFDRMLLRFLETGLAAKHFDLAQVEHRMGIDPSPMLDKGPLRPFSMRDLQLAFICLAVGLALSFFVFLAEIFVGLSL